MRRRGTRRGPGPAIRAVVLLLACLPAAPAVAAPAVEESWSYADEATAAETPGGRQARASIYRGDHLVALRCHSDGQRQWETLVVGATWFHHPKAHLVFELSVDKGQAVVLEFQRETDYRFTVLNPPRPLLRQLGEGSTLAIGGPDFAGEPVQVPLKGSREALDGAFGLCGYDPLPPP